MASALKPKSSFPNVGMDQFLIIKAKNGTEGVQTTGLGPCFGITIQGRDKDGIPILCMAHTSHGILLSKLLEKMIKKINKLGNVIKKPDIHIAGGMPKTEHSDTEDEQREVLQLKAEGKYNIVSAIFNIVKSDDDDNLTMILTPGKVILKKETVHVEEELGTSFDELSDSESDGKEEVEQESKKQSSIKEKAPIKEMLPSDNETTLSDVTD